MRKLALFCATLLASSLSLSASAYSGYIGGGFHTGTHKFNASFMQTHNSTDPTLAFEKAESFSTSGSGLMLKIGQYITPSFAVEAHFIGGLSGDVIRYQDPYNINAENTKHKADVEFKSAWGLFAKPMGFITESTKAYALIGIGGVDFTIENDDPSFKSLSPSTGIAYGLGFETEVQYGVFLGAEYVAYLDNGDGSYNALNVTLSMYVW